MSTNINLIIIRLKVWGLCLATLLLTVVANTLINILTGFNLFSFNVYMIIPAGAVILTFFSLYGFRFGHNVFKKDADLIDLAFLLILALLLQFSISYIDFIFWKATHAVNVSNRIGFYDYFINSITGEKYEVYSSKFGHSAPQTIGEAGWFFFIPRIACMLAIAKYTQFSCGGSAGFGNRIRPGGY